MRVALIGESPKMPSGFGMQIGMLARGLRDRENEVFVLANNPPAFSEDNLECWHIKELDKAAVMDRELAKIKPDVVIVFYHTQQCLDMCHLKYTPRNVPVLFWLPWEGSELPWNGREYFLNVPKDRVVHLSEFAQKLWDKQAPSKWVIPHMIDTDAFAGREYSKKELRRKWAKKLHIPIQSDTLLILNCDRNIWHKRWDATFSYIKQLKAALPDRDIHLLAHTVMHQRGPMGQDGYDLSRIAAMYGIREDVTFTGFDWFNGVSHSEVGELMAMADFRISTSQGEGFGVPTVECAAIGTPQVLNNTTTMPELIGDDESPMLVAPAFAEERLGSIWQVPNIGAMVQQTLAFVENPEVAAAAVLEAQRHVLATFSQKAVCDQWQEALTEIVASENRDACWLKSRWGYTPSMHFESSMSVMPEVLKRLVPDPSILDVGCFKGELVKACAEHGLSVVGIESDEAAYQKAGLMARMHITKQSLLDPWPEADILVLTGVYDLLASEAEAHKKQPAEGYLAETVKRLSNYSWVLLWNEPTGRWDIPSRPEKEIVGHLTAEHVRRHDLEEIIREKVNPGLLHEIWQRGHDTSEIPKGLLFDE